MRAIHKRRRLAVFLGIAVGLALIAAGAAYALTAKSFKYSSPRTGFVIVGHMAFHPDGSSGAGVNGANGLETDTDTCFNAGFDLPPSASRVRAITYYFKSGPSSDLMATLSRRHLATAGSIGFIVNPANDAGTPASVTDAIPAIFQPVKPDRAYGITVCPGNDGNFYGAKVKYTYNSAGS